MSTLHPLENPILTSPSLATLGLSPAVSEAYDADFTQLL